MDIKPGLIEIRKQLSKLLFKFSEVMSNEGIIVLYDGELAEGIEVYSYDADGAKVKLPDGTYNLVLENEKKVVIETIDGIVKVYTLVEDKPVEMPIEETKESVDFSKVVEDLKSNFEKQEIKFNSLVEMLSKLNDVVLSFGSETTVTPIKKIKVEDSVVGHTPASKYFQK